ncbi:MAG: glycogen/starch/alpha-glucan phosphorylase [Eubacteriales bacterium]|nr:glycogen/starch/alpha-glucan phosphorylase [Eubacteriales bacterium]
MGEEYRGDMGITKERFRAELEQKLRAHFGVRGENAEGWQLFSACAILLRERMNCRLAQEETADERRVHYLSMEFLMGRSLEKNAFNLGLTEAMKGALRDMGHDAADILEEEPDAGLGNGGLGRLAACYMDSMATQGLPASGYSICYELGMFRQKIENGAQVETADDWRLSAESWLVPRYEDMCEVRFGGHVEQNWDHAGVCRTRHRDYTPVLAVPRDMLIAGYGPNARVNTLRLWEAHSPNALDMYQFSGGKYVQSLEARTMAEVITKVLYPADDHMEGKTLRLRQQYFFVSATAQSIVREHRAAFGDVRSFDRHQILHINDTHPALIIPELMRIFMDEDGLGWMDAWRLVTGSVAYTNHTVMPEALESWPQGLVQSLLPRIWEILCEIEKRWRAKLADRFGGDGEKINANAIICGGRVRMANLCLCACHKINGVSALHGEILRNELFRDIFRIEPERFGYVTNGIDHRRWLAQINPRLGSLVSELLGDGWLLDAEELGRLHAYRDDAAVLQRLEEIKAANKADFSGWLQKHGGFRLDTGAVLDVQVKRLHEYKRQLLCAMLIAALHQRLREAPGQAFLPRTFLFSAKAASAYTTAKRIIRLIHSLAGAVNADPVCAGRLQVCFLENYRVSAAEALMPAAQVSEQISTTGKEASGTGNMKLMMNGAVTIGTPDGANVEMYSRLGDENMFLFGLRAEELPGFRGSYDPRKTAEQDPELRMVLERFRSGGRAGLRR